MKTADRFIDDNRTDGRLYALSVRSEALWCTELLAMLWR